MGIEQDAASPAGLSRVCRWVTPLMGDQASHCIDSNVVDEWLDIAREVTPDFLGTLTTPNIEWENGDGEAHYNHVNLYSCTYTNDGITIQITGLTPYWDMILRGSQSTVELPPIPEEFGPTSDLAYLQLYRHRVQPGFDFDLWSYDDLARDVQDGFSVTSWYFYLDLP